MSNTVKILDFKLLHKDQFEAFIPNGAYYYVLKLDQELSEQGEKQLRAKIDEYLNGKKKSKKG